MKLRDLNAKFLRRDVSAVDPNVFVDGVKHPDGVRLLYVPVATLAEADGITFECPICKGTKRQHSVICWFVGKVPDDAVPGPGRWTPNGTGLDDLTFVPGKPPIAVSVQLLGEGCRWHGFVKKGEAL